VRPAIVRVAAVRSSTPSGVWWALFAVILPGRVDHHEIGDRAGQGAAEHLVASREAGRPVTDLVGYSRVVGPEPGRTRP
jgi:hypothetical protein